MIIPQYIQYKINTGNHLDQDELDLVVELINKSNDPAFILESFYRLSASNKRQFVKIFPKIKNKTIDAAVGRNEFEGLNGQVNEFMIIFYTTTMKKRNINKSEDEFCP